MPGDRLELALDRLPSADWQYFERFAAEYLSIDYPSLRTTASAHGDKGRDGQLYIPEEDLGVAVQYSLTGDWKGKIQDTVKTLTANFDSVHELIYVTNRVIGPNADELKRSLRRDRGIFLDVRDRSWFVERELSHPQRAMASEELARRIVDPLLEESRIKENVASAITDEDARISLLHLILESKDEASEKGLTKTCFESLVYAALYDSTPDNTVSRAKVRSRVRRIVPAGEESWIFQQVDGALQRQSGNGRAIKYYKKIDEFCLAYPERERVRQKTAEYLLFELDLEQNLTVALRAAAPSLSVTEQEWTEIGRDLRVALEAVLLNRGETFAQAMSTGQAHQVDSHEILRTIGAARPAGTLLTDEQVTTAVIEILDRPSPQVRLYLQRLADAYTMFAFLRQTPDVQKAIVKVFSNGKLWLDASVILPLITETLIDDPSYLYYSTIIRSIKDAGLKLYVTEGVVEEVERHLNRSLICSRMPTQKWHGRIPFVYSMYILSGRSRAKFANWIEGFVGAKHPQDDVAEYLEENHGIELVSLVEFSDQAPSELRAAVQEIWQEAHERRRNAGGEEDVDGMTRHRLIAHDVENTVGVIQIRKGTRRPPFGYNEWWLTLDGIALSLQDKLRQWLGDDAPDSPSISPDFLTQYLRIGPLRTAIERDLRVSLPILTDFSRYDYLPKELIEVAEKTRAEHAELEERAIRRRVRDRLEDEKMRMGPEALGGMRRMHERLEKAISTTS